MAADRKVEPEASEAVIEGEHHTGHSEHLDPIAHFIRQYPDCEHQEWHAIGGDMINRKTGISVISVLSI